MTSNQLYQNLCNAYSDENLNRITAKIIEIYKARNFDLLFDIARAVASHGLMQPEENSARCFSKLLMIYHPDRATLYRTEIGRLNASGDVESMKQYGHIFEMTGIEQLQVTVEPDYEDIDYHPEYVWDYEIYNPNFFSQVDEENLAYQEDEEYYEYSAEPVFFNAMKQKLFGSTDIELPVHNLEDFDEIEVSDYGLTGLEGVEYCVNLVKLDLSYNRIHDISLLVVLYKLEELYLNENELTAIDSCMRLKNLRVLDIAHNQIEDIRCLFTLEHLEFVNLVGNPVTQSQIDNLRNQGVIVVC